MCETPLFCKYFFNEDQVYINFATTKKNLRQEKNHLRHWEKICVNGNAYGCPWNSQQSKTILFNINASTCNFEISVTNTRGMPCRRYNRASRDFKKDSECSADSFKRARRQCLNNFWTSSKHFRKVRNRRFGPEKCQNELLYVPKFYPNFQVSRSFLGLLSWQ